MEICRIDFFSREWLWERNSDITCGRTLCWFQVPLKALQKEFMKRFFSRGKSSFIALAALLYVQKKLAAFSHSQYTTGTNFAPYPHIFVIRDAFGPHTYLHGPFSPPSSSWAHRISLLPPFLLGQISWCGHGTKGKAFSGLEIFVLVL